MKHPHNARAPAFDATAIDATIQRALATGPPDPAPPRPASFERHEFEGATGGLAYKMYVPASPAEGPRALLVKLHGCAQSADDFAAGTQMNRLAEEQGCLVVCPEQAAQAHASKCWNRFRPQDQGRDAVEPALFAGVGAHSGLP